MGRERADRAGGGAKRSTRAAPLLSMSRGLAARAFSRLALLGPGTSEKRGEVKIDESERARAARPVRPP